MRKIQCMRILEIDAGHRLVNHESKCRNAHGHRYKFEIHCEADGLDSVGRVIDFGAVKEIVGTWLDDNWDHAFIAQNEDPIVSFLQQNNQKHFLMSVPPTAENLAQIVMNICMVKLPKIIRCVKVVCWETPNCSAEVTEDGTTSLASLN